MSEKNKRSRLQIRNYKEATKRRDIYEGEVYELVREMENKYDISGVDQIRAGIRKNQNI